MTPAEISRQVARDLYTLDTQGYVVVENALSAAQVDELLEGVAHGVELDPPTANKSQDDGSSRRYSGCLRWGAPFVRLVDNPRVTPLLHGALGADVRLDHEYTHCLERNTSGTPVIRGQIHGGPGNQAGGWNLGTMISVVYDLVDVDPADGGFGAVAGSHHAAFRLPIPSRVDPETQTYPDLVTRVSCKAGSAIVFTESMAHCTLPWTGEGERITLFYKYTALADSPSVFTRNYAEIREGFPAGTLPQGVARLLRLPAGTEDDLDFQERALNLPGRL
jgi:hypothetical protein